MDCDHFVIKELMNSCLAAFLLVIVADGAADAAIAPKMFRRSHLTLGAVPPQ